MENSLDSVLSAETAQPEEVVQPEQVEQTEQETADTGEPVTGEESTATPAEEPKDELDKAGKGLVAAATAERRKRQEAEQRAEMLQQQLQAMQQPKQPQQTADGKPLRSQFATEDEWLDARDAWRDGQAQQAKQEEQAQERASYLQRTANEMVNKGRVKFQDFDAVINDELGPFITPGLQQTLLLSERGHEVAYWLAKNQTEAQRVATLPPLMLARELAIIETKLDAAPPTRTVEKTVLPETLTQARDTRGRFEPVYSGPTPLDAILATK